MIFGFKVIEEGSLANVGGFGDLLDCDVTKPALGNQLKSAPEQFQPGFRAAAFPASGACLPGHFNGNKGIGESGWRRYATVLHE
jgi:hypothetical protein